MSKEERIVFISRFGDDNNTGHKFGASGLFLSGIDPVKTFKRAMEVLDEND